MVLRQPEGGPELLHLGGHLPGTADVPPLQGDHLVEVLLGLDVGGVGEGAGLGHVELWRRTDREREGL